VSTAVLLLLALLPLTAQQPVLKRASLTAVERTLDRRLERFIPEDPFVLMGNTRALYLKGFGTVFTAEVDLIQTPSTTPFRGGFSKEELARIRQRKLSRLPQLRQVMRDMLLASAPLLEEMPPSELIVLGISLFTFSWEDKTGLPAQIVMQGPRAQLLKRIESAIATQEF
jgi:hypothetical protein